MYENTSLYISIVALIVSLTSALVSIHTRRRIKRDKMIFKKLKNGEELDHKETLRFQKLRGQMGAKIKSACYHSRR